MPKSRPNNSDPISYGDLSVLSGTSITLWSDSRLTGDTCPEPRLQLAPDRPAIVGRAEGYEVPYLDPAYRPTTVVPGTGQSVLGAGAEWDICVSRGHFMLRADVGGILFVNGVPKRGGGIRPPLNGTWLLRPDYRPLGPGEEYLIAHGTAVEIALPNQTAVRIEAR